MLKFYLGLVREIPSAFRGAVEAWLFWGGTVILTVLAFFNPELGKALQTGTLSRWIVVVPIALALVYGLLKANHRRFLAMGEALDSVKKEAAVLVARVAAIESDQYAYGLVVGIQAVWDKGNPAAAIQFSLSLESVVDAPLRYHVDHFRVWIGGHGIKDPTFANAGEVMPRRGKSHYRFAAFPQRVIDELGQRFPGRVEYAIRYGHPDAGFVRFVRRSFDMGVVLERGIPEITTGNPQGEDLPLSPETSLAVGGKSG